MPDIRSCSPRGAVHRLTRTAVRHVELVLATVNVEQIRSRNFRVLLGEGSALPEKIVALPKALRLCEHKRDKLLYLDASNPQRFYMKWREP